VCVNKVGSNPTGPPPVNGSPTCPAFTFGVLSLQLSKLPKLQILILDNANVIILDLKTINMFKKMVALQFLSLHSATDRSLSKTLPFDAFVAPKLVFLDIGLNGFTGPLPSKFVTLANLKFLHVAQNDFSGTLISTIF
jgi:hypothetical protein